MTYVVFNTLTGCSDESMRFGSYLEACAWIDARDDSDNFMIRIED